MWVLLLLLGWADDTSTGQGNMRGKGHQYQRNPQSLVGICGCPCLRGMRKCMQNENHHHVRWTGKLNWGIRYLSREQSQHKCASLMCIWKLVQRLCHGRSRCFSADVH